MTTTWKAVHHRAEDNGAGKTVLQDLINQTMAVAVIENGLNHAECAGVAAAIAQHRAAATVNAYKNASLTTFGPYIARHLKDPTEYFSAADSGSVIFPPAHSDLREVVRGRLASWLGLNTLSVAQEPDGRLYSPAVVRLHANGVNNPLHNDHIARDCATTGLTLSKLRHQFSCIACLQECDSGGELLHYRKRWVPEDEQFKVADGLGYLSDVVADVAECQFRPQTGSVYVIDPRNYHAIKSVAGKDRLTMGFFFGFFDDELTDGVCWS